MPHSALLGRDFFDRSVVTVARALLGQRVVRVLEGQRVSVLVTEVEAYDGEQDTACHAHNGPTKRNAVMYGPPGHAYVYFTYGMHWLLNCVTGAQGYPAAVLIRAALPLENPAIIAVNRPGINQHLWLSGPARLTRALQIDGTLNGINLCSPGTLTLEKGFYVEDSQIACSARIGVDYASEPWKSMPWRFFVQNAEQWLTSQPGMQGMV